MPCRSFACRTAFAGFVAALVAAPLSYPAAQASSDSAELWSPATARAGADAARVHPIDYESFRLDRRAMAALLDDAPAEGARAAAQVVSVPAPTGELVDFAVTESPVMQSRLAARHPEIRTYAGHAVEDPTATIRLDLTPMGFHASVRGDAAQGAWYVDPAYDDASGKSGENRYLSYLGSDLPKPDDGFTETGVEGVAKRLEPAPARRAVGEVEKRTYRLALVSDPSYARYFGTENVLAEKATLINRVNQIYNDDLAVRLVLVNGTEKLNLDTVAKATKPNGPCGPHQCYEPGTLTTCGHWAIERTGLALGQLIGAGRYDIGHLALGRNGGGVAGLGVVGGPHKAIGCTGLPTPEGDFYGIDYVAHEMGHQFGANHTFNGTKGACSGGNRNAGTSVEPGSGSSVMAYAGICGSDDLQPHTDPYFSQRSIKEIGDYVSSDQPPVNEMQTVSLRDFDQRKDRFRLRTGAGRTAPIGYGEHYTARRVDRVLEAKLGDDTVKVTGWGDFDDFGQQGFSVMFRGDRAGENQPSLSVVPTGGDVTGFARESRHGGPSGNGGAVSDTGNHTPTVNAPADKRIPLRTPFTLGATGSDEDGDALTYSWEQNDRAAKKGTALMKSVKENGPLFRIFGRYANVTPAGTLEYDSPGENHTSGDPSRTFPDLSQVLAGNTNAKSGTCPKASGRRKTACHSEWLPTRDYTGRKEAALHFRVTARDHHVDGGGTAHDDVTLTLARKAGPLSVTSYGEPGAAVRGTRTQPIDWMVNKTNRPALAPKVRITLSTDGGKTFDTVLKKSTKNDGHANVTWPNVDADRARIKVEAVGNYFFAVNAADFTIIPVD